MTILPRGVRLEPHREEPLKQGIQELPKPAELWVPLVGCTVLSERLVEPGDWVDKGAPLSAPQRSVPAHAPAAGRIKEIRELPLPLQGTVPCALLVPDWAYEGPEQKPPAQGQQEEVISAAASAGIIDEFDGLPLYKKLKRFRRRGVNLLLANAIDDDPYVASAVAVLREQPQKVADGLAAAARACGAAECRVTASSRKEMKRVHEACPAVEPMPAGERYPARALLKRGLYAKGNTTGFIGVQACAALASFLENGTPQTETVVTVAGDAVPHPYNLRVPVGTPLRELLAFCGVEGTPGACFVGSSITGKRAPDLDAPVTLDTRCLIALQRQPRWRTYPCIGCGSCVRACPRGIRPWEVCDQLSRENPDPLRMVNVQHCIACAACSLACPSGIDFLAQMLRAAEFKKGGE